MSTEFSLEQMVEQMVERIVDRKLAEREAESGQSPDEELTVRQLMALKKVKRRTVYDWVEKRRIPFHRTPGGQLRFYRRHLEGVHSAN